jgi:hypothetical protein
LWRECGTRSARRRALGQRMRLHDAAIEDAEPLFHQRISFDAVDVEGPKDLDRGLANELYATLLGPVEQLIKDKSICSLCPRVLSPHCRFIYL